MNFVEGFSKFSREEKINWISENFLNHSKKHIELLKSYWHPKKEVEELHSEFSENTLSHFYLPFSIAPNFLIHGKYYALPMVCEESSVVAAACKTAKFWATRGGFSYVIKDVKKPGHVYFKMNVSYEKLKVFFEETLKSKLIQNASPLIAKMKARGGGLLEIHLKNKTNSLALFQLEGIFDTCEAMGANFINSVLENFAATLENEIYKNEAFSWKEKNSFEVIMAILSNYTPDCLVRAQVECSIKEFGKFENYEGKRFIDKFIEATQIANHDIYRAVTHNKGILNGVDALVLATGNDFRAVEASCHAYAAKEGKYRSLSKAEIKENIFTFWVELPISVGTLGGLTSLHPLAKLSLEILGKPSSQELMGIIAVAGLAQNFGAISSLITTGIQKGHMKMHLQNILGQLGASEQEKLELTGFFKDKAITYLEVAKTLEEIREKKN